MTEQIERHRLVEEHQNLDVGAAVVNEPLSVLVQVAGFVMGLVGFVGGISRGAAWTIVIATIGILLNGGILVLSVLALLALK